MKNYVIYLLIQSGYRDKLSAWNDCVKQTPTHNYFRIQPICIATLALLVVLLTQLPAVAQDAPIARIILPVRGQTLQGNISIQGSATAPKFTRYQVLYAVEPDLLNWILINGAAQPVANGLLGVWNTRPVPDGKYALITETSPKSALITRPSTSYLSF